MSQLEFEGGSGEPGGRDRPVFPRRLYPCTPSRLNTWVDCPRRYRMTYLDRPRPQKGPPWGHNSLGASVHNALAGWWRLPLERRTPEAAGTLLERGWIEEGYRDAEQSAAWRARARDMVIGYVAGLDPADEPVGVERTVGMRTDRITLSGRVDRLDVQPGESGDEVVVVDYKTGRHVLTTDDARGSLALALYAVAAARVLRRPCRTVELHHLPSGETVSWEHSDETLARHLRRAEEIAEEAAGADAAFRDGLPEDRYDEVFPPRPGALCAWCDFAPHCPEGRAAYRTRRPWEGLATEDEPLALRLPPDRDEVAAPAPQLLRTRRVDAQVAERLRHFVPAFPREADTPSGDLDELREAVARADGAPRPATYGRTVTERLDDRDRVVGGGPPRADESVKTLPQWVERGERMARGDLDDDAAARVVREGGDDPPDVGGVVQHVVTGHDVGWRHVVGDVRPAALHDPRLRTRRMRRVGQGAEHRRLLVDRGDGGGARRERERGRAPSRADVEDGTGRYERFVRAGERRSARLSELLLGAAGERSCRERPGRLVHRGQDLVGDRPRGEVGAPPVEQRGRVTPRHYRPAPAADASPP